MIYSTDDLRLHEECNAACYDACVPVFTRLARVGWNASVYCGEAMWGSVHKLRELVEWTNKNSSYYPKTTFATSLIGSATTLTGLDATMSTIFGAGKVLSFVVGSGGVLLQGFFEYILIAKPKDTLEPVATSERASLLPSSSSGSVSDDKKNIMLIICVGASLCSAILVFIELELILVGVFGVNIVGTLGAIFFAIFNFIISVLSGQNVLEDFFEVIFPKIKKDINASNWNPLCLVMIYFLISLASVPLTYSAPFMKLAFPSFWDRAGLLEKIASMLIPMGFNASVIPAYFNFAYDFFHHLVGEGDRTNGDNESWKSTILRNMFTIPLLAPFLLAAFGNGLGSGKIISDGKYFDIALGVAQGITVLPSSLFSAASLVKIAEDFTKEKIAPKLISFAQYMASPCIREEATL